MNLLRNYRLCLVGSIIILSLSSSCSLQSGEIGFFDCLKLHMRGFSSYTAIRKDRMLNREGAYDVMESRYFFKEPHVFRSEGYLLNGQSQDFIIVCDGTRCWNEVENLVSVDRVKFGGWWLPRWTGILRTCLAVKHVSLAGESELDGVEVLEFERPGDFLAEKTGVVTERLFIGKHDGIARRVIGYDGRGVLVVETMFTDVQIVEDLDDKLFTYAPPPDATIMDLER